MAKFNPRQIQWIFKKGPRSQDKRAGISKKILLFSTLSLYIPWPWVGLQKFLVTILRKTTILWDVVSTFKISKKDY